MVTPVSPACEYRHSLPLVCWCDKGSLAHRTVAPTFRTQRPTRPRDRCESLTNPCALWLDETGLFHSPAPQRIDCGMNRLIASLIKSPTEEKEDMLPVEEATDGNASKDEPPQDQPLPEDDAEKATEQDTDVAKDKRRDTDVEKETAQDNDVEGETRMTEDPAVSEQHPGQEDEARYSTPVALTSAAAATEASPSIASATAAPTDPAQNSPKTPLTHSKRSSLPESVDSLQNLFDSSSSDDLATQRRRDETTTTSSHVKNVNNNNNEDDETISDWSMDEAPTERARRAVSRKTPSSRLPGAFKATPRKTPSISATIPRLALQAVNSAQKRPAHSSPEKGSRKKKAKTTTTTTKTTTPKKANVTKPKKAVVDGAAPDSITKQRKGKFKTLTTVQASRPVPVEDPDENIGRPWPPGWKRRFVPRIASVSRQGGDKYWYTPKIGFEIRSIKQVKLFLELLEKHDGDEQKTMQAMGGAK